MPGWFDSNEINESRLAEYLTTIKKMANTPAPVLDMQSEWTDSDGKGGIVTIRRGGPDFPAGESHPEDLFNFAFGRVHTYATNLTSFKSFIMPNAAAQQRGSGVALPLPGYVENVFIPQAITGINAKSSHKDIARDFLKIILSKDVQRIKLDDGFAVNISALSDTMELENNLIGMNNPSATVWEMLITETPDVEQQQRIFDLCLAVKTPCLLDSTLAEMVLSEAKGYFSGEKNINTTISDIRERTRIYLAE
jgi:ABC-type glycerol-3-phosphate transport system substrate-binding protein